jgi:hypothetical protein
VRGRGDLPHGEYFAQTYAFQTLGGMSTAFRPAKAVFGERIWVEVHPQLGVLGKSTGLIFTKIRDRVMGISDQHPIQSRLQTATASSGSTAAQVLDRRMQQLGVHRWVGRQPGRLGRGSARVPGRRVHPAAGELAI